MSSLEPGQETSGSTQERHEAGYATSLGGLIIICYKRLLGQAPPALFITIKEIKFHRESDSPRGSVTAVNTYYGEDS
jgi:hypothetical protein